MSYIYKSIFFAILFTSNTLFTAIGVGVSVEGVLDSELPSIETLYPNGGEVFTFGDNIDVSWTATDSSFGETPIKIYFSYDGVTYQDSTDFEENDGAYSWQVPDEPTNSANIFIFAVDEFGNMAYDYSDSLFSIQGTYYIWHVAIWGSDETGEGTEINPFATICYIIV